MTTTKDVLPEVPRELYELAKRMTQKTETQVCFMWTGEAGRKDSLHAMDDRGCLESAIEIMLRRGDRPQAASFWSEGWRATFKPPKPGSGFDTPELYKKWILSQRSDAEVKHGPNMSKWPAELRTEVMVFMYVDHGFECMVSTAFDRAADPIAWSDPEILIDGKDGGTLLGTIPEALRVLIRKRKE